jgi:hypothetical protein
MVFATGLAAKEADETMSLTVVNISTSGSYPKY